MAWSMKNVGPNRRGRFKQGFFRPNNPSKYIGEVDKIIYRSSWEHGFMKNLDQRENVIRWSSEDIAIPYINPLDEMKNPPVYGKVRHYYVDFFFTKRNSDGSEQDYIIEVKPLSQVPTEVMDIKGKKTKRRLINYIKEAEVHLLNKAKFEAAITYAEERGAKFGIVTEGGGYF